MTPASSPPRWRSPCRSCRRRTCGLVLRSCRVPAVGLGGAGRRRGASAGASMPARGQPQPASTRSDRLVMVPLLPRFLYVPLRGRVCETPHVARAEGRGPAWCARAKPRAGTSKRRPSARGKARQGALSFPHWETRRFPAVPFRLRLHRPRPLGIRGSEKPRHSKEFAKRDGNGGLEKVGPATWTGCPCSSDATRLSQQSAAAVARRTRRRAQREGSGANNA